MTIYQEKYKIRGNETGPHLNMTLPAVAGLLQEAAWMHSMDLGVSVYELLEKGLTWVLSRLIIEMDGFVRHNDVVTVVTWPSGFDRNNIYRDYHLQDHNGNVVGKAKSIWAILDLKTRQVIAPPSFITELAIQFQVPHVKFNTGKIPVAESYVNKKTFTANWYDIDINRHVNHISYIKWVIESAPLEVLKKKEATAIDIFFKAESEYGDEIMGYSLPDVEGSTILHKLSLKNSGKELTFAKTNWK